MTARFSPFFVFSVFFVLSVVARAPVASAVSVSDLRTGDILLQPLNCYLCNVIEKVEESIYSHSAVVVRDNSGEVHLLESLGDVHSVSLSDFLLRTQKHQFVRVLRPREFAALGNEWELRDRMLETFSVKYRGLGFDHGMLWDNLDITGRELLYCSEFVSKFVNEFLRDPYQTKAMHYDVQRNFWLKYFSGNIPDGKPGIAPSDFQRSALTLDLGDLNQSPQ
jgi:hypothetical protein